jgi:hypothetical protein
MKYILTALSCVFSISLLSAQPPSAGGNRMGGQSITGRLYGKIVEAKSGKAVEYASVQLLKKN